MADDDDFLNMLGWQQEQILQAMGIPGMIFRPPDLVSPVRPRLRLMNHDQVIPGGPMIKSEPVSAAAEQVTTIGTCTGCGMSDILGDYRLCRYCGELARLHAAQEKIALPAERAWPWPWPQTFLGRFWLVFLALAAGVVIGMVS